MVWFTYNLIAIADFNILGHILPIAIGHQCGPESAESWSWFLQKILDAYPDFQHGALLMDHDKGGSNATEFVCLLFLFTLNLFLFRSTLPYMRVQSCCNHIKDNVDKKFGNIAAKTFAEASQQTLETEFYAKLAKLVTMLPFELYFIFLIFLQKQQSFPVCSRNRSLTVCKVFYSWDIWANHIAADRKSLGSTGARKKRALNLNVHISFEKIL